MWTSILKHARRFRRDEGGNVFILFGATAIPLLLVMGGAVDLMRFSRHKAELSHAVDAAALALARRGEDYSLEQAQDFVEEYVAAFNLDRNGFEVGEILVDETDEGYSVSADGAMQTIFLPLGDMAKSGGGIRSMDLEIFAEAVRSTNRLELALVFDNTGSMNCAAVLGTTCALNWSNPAADSRIRSLKTAAKTLVDTLMRDDLEDKSQIKIALVPFEGMVNVASTGFSVTSPPTWVDWADQGGSTWNGANLTARKCDNTTGTALLGHKCLFTKLTAKFPTVKWAGCVEMRAGTYELTDDAPNTTIKNSLFVPFFHPDEPDSTTTVGTSSSAVTRYNNRSNGASNGTAYTYQNDYLHDKAAFTTPAAAQKSPTKYLGTGTAAPAFHSGRMDVEGLLTPYEYGPNKGCPRPIYALANANNKAAIKTQIDAMIAYWSTGTFIPTGLMWGWHVLSPTLPYTEGTKPGDEYYEQTVKAIVLFTDGENDVTDDGNPNKSRYNAYSYVGTTVGTATRLGSSATAAITSLDTKTATACTNVKNAGIRLYTITFGTLDSTSTNLMRNCATVNDGEALYYHAPSTADLEDIFYRIGQDLSDIHLSM